MEPRYEDPADWIDDRDQIGPRGEPPQEQPGERYCPPMEHVPGKMPPKIAQALVKAQAHASGVGKSSKNTHHNYKYASAEAIVTEAREALAHAGLGVLCESWHQVKDDPHDRLVVRYLVIHESGDTWAPGPVSTPVIPDRGRPQDKAEATALTYNLGYFQRGLLNLPRVEEGADVDQRDDSRHEPPPRRNGRRAPLEQRGHDRDEELRGGKHAGTRWRDVPVDYLSWAAGNARNDDLRARAQAELDARDADAAEAAQDSGPDHVAEGMRKGLFDDEAAE